MQGRGMLDPYDWWGSGFLAACLPGPAMHANHKLAAAAVVGAWWRARGKWKWDRQSVRRDVPETGPWSRSPRTSRRVHEGGTWGRRVPRRGLVQAGPGGPELGGRGPDRPSHDWAARDPQLASLLPMQ